jgi:hypothetical protein
VWLDVQKRFVYPLDQYNEALCKGHAMVITGKALRTLRYKLNKNYVQKGKTPMKTTTSSRNMSGGSLLKQ